MAQVLLRQLAYRLSHVHKHLFINELTGVPEVRELRHVHPLPQSPEDENAARVHTHLNGVEHLHPHGHGGYAVPE